MLDTTNAKLHTLGMLLIIKGVLCLIWLLISCIITTFVSIIRPRNPSNGYFFAMLFTSVCKFILGIKVEIKNKERLIQNQPCIYIGNHQSNLDVIIQGCGYSPRTVVIGKKEIMYIPFFNLVFFLTGNVFLNRKKKDTAVASLIELKDYIQEKNISVYIFPEGTRNHGAKELLPFKHGGFHLALGAQVPLVPIVASPIYPLVDFKNWKIKKGTITLEVLEPISTIGKTVDDMESLVQAARVAMQTKFNELVTQVN